MKYYYSIAGMRIECDIPFPVTVTIESEAFLQEAWSSDPDLSIRFMGIEDLDPPSEEGFWDIDRYHTKDFIYYCLSPGGKPYARVKQNWEKPCRYLCEYLKRYELCLACSSKIVDVISLNTLLLHKHGILLHCSFIRWQDSGILFSAPSGTGKSTQAELWKNYEGAEIINGDRAGVRKIENTWMAEGLPYAGSSYIYRNEGAPIKAIIVLRQAKQNIIRRLKPAEAIRYLYPEVSVHHWDKSFAEGALNLLYELTTELPVFLLECLPDEDAVKTAKKAIFDETERSCV